MNLNFMDKIKKYIYKLIDFKNNKTYYIQNLSKIRQDKKDKIILMGSPEYNNLGDHAIAFATSYFVKHNFKDKSFYEITENEVSFRLNKIKKFITERDIILLQGGGNMGDMYPDQEVIRKKIIKNLKNNKIIIMPQTIYYENKAKLPNYYYNKNIIFCARESKSYDFFKKNLKQKIILCPDIVMYLINIFNLRIDKKEKKDNAALVCVREDKEKLKDRISLEDIKKELLNKYEAVNQISTVLECGITIQNREKELNRLMEEISKYSVFITDRLHGMILATIVGTPCIVLPTFNYKVTESYKWLERLNTVILMDNNSSFSENIETIKERQRNNNFNLQELYNELIKEMQNK